MAGEGTVVAGVIQLRHHQRHPSLKFQVIATFSPLLRLIQRNIRTIRIIRRPTTSILVTSHRHPVRRRRCRCLCRPLTITTTAEVIPRWIPRIGSVGDTLMALLCRPKLPMLSIRRRLPYEMMSISRRKLLRSSLMKKTLANSLYHSRLMPPLLGGLCSNLWSFWFFLLYL